MVAVLFDFLRFIRLSSVGGSEHRSSCTAFLTILPSHDSHQRHFSTQSVHALLDYFATRVAHLLGAEYSKEHFARSIHHKPTLLFGMDKRLQLVCGGDSTVECRRRINGGTFGSVYEVHPGLSLPPNHV